MKYKCLILDHDDTVAKSTPDIHYPSFIEALKVLRPNYSNISLEEFILKCFNPGFSELCKNILHFNDKEQEYQYNIWTNYTKTNIPEFYAGFKELINDFKKNGGIVCVSSHSESHRIKRDYIVNCGIEPDKIFGWDIDEDKRKPSPYSIEETIRLFKLKQEDILVVDDLKPGLDMANAGGVDFASAGWSHLIPEIINYMKDNSKYYLRDVKELRNLIFEKDN